MLLIPRRIEQIKEEGRKEGFREGIKEARLERRKEAEARLEAFWEGFQAGRESRKPQVDDEEPASIETIIAWYHSGGITLKELEAILARIYKGRRESD